MMPVSQRTLLARIATVGVLAVAPVPQSRAQSSTAAAHDHSVTGGRVMVLPRDLEMRLAVNALPRDLRAGATVLIMESAGYVKARQGPNPFTCDSEIASAVSHRQAGAVAGPSAARKWPLARTGGVSVAGEQAAAHDERGHEPTRPPSSHESL